MKQLGKWIHISVQFNDRAHRAKDAGKDAAPLDQRSIQQQTTAPRAAHLKLVEQAPAPRLGSVKVSCTATWVA